MTTTVDASGVMDTDATLVAVRVLSPKALWTRMKIRALRALRAVRLQAAQRQAAIAQFVKPYWERVPSGLTGFAALATLSHPPAYRWVMRRVQTVTSFSGRVLRTGLGWLGKAGFKVGMAGAQVLTWMWPSAGNRAADFVLRQSERIGNRYEKICNAVATRHSEFYTAATSPAAMNTLRKMTLPLAIGVGANLATQGLVAATVASVPVIGPALALALSTTRGMMIAGGTITAIALYDGYGQLRKEKAAAPAQAPQAGATASEVVEGQVVPPMGSDEVLTLNEQVVETRTVKVGDEQVVIEVAGAAELSEEEAMRIAQEHVAKQEADEEAELRTLEAETGVKGTQPKSQARAKREARAAKKSASAKQPAAAGGGGR